MPHAAAARGLQVQRGRSLHPSHAAIGTGLAAAGTDASEAPIAISGLVTLLRAACKWIRRRRSDKPRVEPSPALHGERCCWPRTYPYRAHSKGEEEVVFRDTVMQRRQEQGIPCRH